MQTLDMRIEDPVTIVIFGATGDLTRRKLAPALYELFRAGVLAKDFSVIGFARRDLQTEAFREMIAESLRMHGRTPPDEASLQSFCSHVAYHRGDLEEAGAYAALARLLSAGGLPANRLFYLSIMPHLIETVTGSLAGAGLISPHGRGPWTRVVAEKPFGRDLQSARALNETLLDRFDESQIYRIDHYLGKETVQNILSFRFANTIFEPVLNRNYVDHIQITAAETVGMESGRGAYYDEYGALRDMVANHLFQLVALTAMEAPDGLSARSVRNEKVKVLRALKLSPPLPGHPAVCCGQYGRADHVKAFREEERVRPQSATETFAALRMEIGNWRWSGVPFYLRTGKRMARKTTSIAVQFKTPPLALFQHVACQGDVCDLTGVRPNMLIFRIQPDEGIFLQVSAKRPSMQLAVESVNMDFSYSGRWNKALPEAYERLLMDALRGDSTLFTRSDEVEAEWEVINTILGAAADQQPHLYAPGTWGPAEADALLLNGARWRNE